MRKSILFIIAMVFLSITGCQSQPVQQATATPVQGTPTPMPGLTLESIKNAAILAPELQKNVQLIDGKYEGGSGLDYSLVEILPQSTVGDVNGDGQQDAVVVLAENGGGSGVFVSLVVFLSHDNGFSQSQAALIDDRAQVNSVTVSDGKISVDALIHGANDAMASPSLHVLEIYQLYGNALTLVGLDSTPNGTEHSIQIDTPTNRQSLTGNIEVKGSMSAAPFENTLRYRFYDESGKVLDEGAFMVKSEDAGKPATFDNSLTLPAVPSGTKLRLELADLSAKDGSPVCIVSVDLMVK
jgi:Immunoglobulin-like domain of bacterial spore germination